MFSGRTAGFLPDKSSALVMGHTLKTVCTACERHLQNRLHGLSWALLKTVCTAC